MKQPRQFKTQAEIWQFLLDGNKVTDNANIYFFEDDIFYFKRLGSSCYSQSSENFMWPSSYQEYIEPSWKDKLDGTVYNGVWCWCGDRGLNREGVTAIRLITSYYEDKYCDWDLVSWVSATPVTNEEFDGMKNGKY